MNSDYQLIKEKIVQEEKFVLISHVNPDGDSIGSMAAMGHLLAVLKKDFVIIVKDKTPAKYRFLLDGLPLAESLYGFRDAVCIAVDSSDLSRLGGFADQIDKMPIINIDHHVSNTRFGIFNLVVPEAAATGEIIYDLFQLFSISIDSKIAECLYVAISTDTGNYKFSNTSHKSFSITASLLQTGFDLRGITTKIFDEISLPAFCLLKEGLQTLELSKDKKIAWIVIDNETLNNCSATSEDLDGLINYTINMKNVEVGLLFHVKKTGEIKVGFRSTKNVNVSIIAQSFGGGGHKNAAGCTFKNIPLEQVKTKVLKQIDVVLS